MFLIMSAIQVWLTQADWVMVDSSFLKGFTSNSNWQKSCSFFEAGAFHEYNTCNQNQLQYARLKKFDQRIDKIFDNKSYQSEVIVDIFFDNDANFPSDKIAYFTLNLTQSTTLKDILQQRAYLNSHLTQNARIICNSTTTQYFDFKTFVGTSPVQYKEKFNISIGIETEDDKQIIGIRNLFVYVKYCLPTCKTCSSSTSCLTCYYGTPTGGICSCDPSHQFAQTGIGCRQECARDYFIARSDNICVLDRRIKSNVSYFEFTTFSAYSPFQFVLDTANVRSSPSLIHTCSSISYVGSLLFNEGMSLQFANSQSLKFIRLRITFYIKGFLTDNKIQILLDDQIQGEIIKSTSDYIFHKVQKIQSSTVNCSTYDLIRIETILRTYSVTPKLILKGAQLTQATSIWGFRNITIDSGICQENCAICTDFSTCQMCNTGYVLFQNQCVSACPVHSANCVDYADMIPYSRYLAKGFYNLNMSTSDINQFFDETITTSSNFLTGQKFSIFPTKFVIGGVMVWNNAIYQKLWSISKPHYAVTIRFNVTYGDLYGGNFYYTIQGVKSVAHPKPSSGGQNFIGKNLNEITKYFEIFQNPFKSSSLNIEFQCTDTIADPRDQFCAISDYFIVVHYCLPFCQDCNDGVSCVIWETGHTNQNCNTNQYLYFDSIQETYSCITCNQPGCLTCKNLDECTSCDSSSQYNTLMNGVCLSINTPSPPSPFVQCHKQCETCTGALKTDCQTCVSDFHRTLLNNECLCQPGFYDDGINLTCLPVCGDLLIVHGEDCDDGNYNPYDGCNNCKFVCDNTCKECILGICFDCQQGFQIIDYRCVAICGDNFLVETEECDDSNQIPNDGCYNCKFSCSNHCIDCQFNKCIKCDESNGWYLMDNICQPICGDGIVAIQFEQCDDNNQQDSNDLLNQNFCFQCLFTCQDSCSTCYNGQCYQCHTGWNLNTIEKNCNPIDGDKLVVGNEQCDDGNKIQNDGCFLSQFQYDISCEQGFQGQCQKCISGFVMINNICKENNLDGLVVGIEQCDDQNLIGQDGCFQNRFDCPQFCLTCVAGYCLECDRTSGFGQIDQLNNRCLSFCGDGIISIEEYCDDGNQIPYDGCFICQFSCDFNCIDCQKGICHQCQFGYYLNYLDNSCFSICGDGIVASNESCDEGSVTFQQGCQNCQIKCQNECLNCVLGQCYRCIEFGWEIDLDSRECKSNCGDGITVGREQCDDGNEIELDGCFQCKCELGWISNQQSCQSICGDQIIVFGEQCDDGNIVQFDGCYQCKYDCNESCIECIEGICIKCNEGFILDKNECIITCGDGILNKLTEQCDDYNNIPRDGCYNCDQEDGFICYYSNQLLFQTCERCTDYYCLQCVIQIQRQICQKCMEGYYIDQYQGCSQCDKICVDCIISPKNCLIFDSSFYQLKHCNQTLGSYYHYELKDCVSKCGDGIINGEEQCDDLNTNDFDGCNHKCQIESGYLFDLQSLSFISEPTIQVLSHTSSNKDFSIFANQFQDTINCTGTTMNIELFNQSEYNYTIIEQGSKCDISMQYFKTVEQFNLIHILIKFKNHFSKRTLNESPTKEIIIVPKRQVYVNEDQKEQGKSMAAAQKSISSSIVVFAPLALLIGGFKFIWAILDVMSWMNNFYFLNVNYPENVRLIFQQAEWSNLINFPQLNIFNQPSDEYYFQAQIKFSEKDVDPLFINNIQIVIIFLFQVLITQLICFLIRRLIQKLFKKYIRIKNSNSQIFQLKTNINTNFKQENEIIRSKIENQVFFIEIPNNLKSIYFSCVNCERFFVANLLKTLQISYLDILLAIVLQITNQQTSYNLIVKINIILAIISIGFVLLLIHLSYHISVQHHLKLDNHYFSRRYSCFYEDIKTNSNISMTYSFVNMLRKTIFIVATVLLYSFPIYQTSVCFLSCFMNIILLILCNPFNNRQQYILNLIPDFCICIIVGITIIFAFQDQFQILEDDTIYILGWIIGACIYLSILLQLMFLIKELIQSIWEKIKELFLFLRNRFN